jgi:hypothetical protein
MTKETPELITECWQLLVEYIPRRDHVSAAEQLVTYLESILDKDELRAITDLDSDLADAYKVILDDEPLDEDEEY